MTAPVVIFAIGNPSRGDDALGPSLLARLAGCLADAGLAQHFELIEDFQLQIEHALDLAGRRLALFIDAGIRTPGPYCFFPIKPAARLAHTTHALSPETVLEVFQRTEGEAPPPAFVLCIRGESFVLGEALSPAARLALDAAFDLLKKLCRAPELAVWQAESELAPA